MKKIIKLSASVLATVILSLACGHGTAAMNRAAAVSVFSPNNSTLPMCTSTVSGMTGFNSASKAATSSSSPLAMNNSSSMAGLVYASGDSGNSSSSAAQSNHSDNAGSNTSPAAPANNSGKSGSGSGTVAHSENSGKASGGSGTVAPPKHSGSTGGGSTTAGKKAGNSGGKTNDTIPTIAGSDTHKAEAAYDMDAIKRELIAYGESKGLHYNSSLTVGSSAYDSPVEVLQDCLNEADFIKGEKEGIDYQIQCGYSGADFNPYFVRKSSKTNDYRVYELFR